MSNVAISLLTDTFSSLISLLTYLAAAYGLYCMSASVGLKNNWMAWIPFCREYVLGYVADEYCRRNENRSTSYRKKLLGWMIALTAALALLFVALSVLVVVLVIMGIATSLYDSEAIMNGVSNLDGGFLLGIGLFVLIAVVVILPVVVVYTVFRYTALHKVYKLFAPDSATLYLVLSIFVPLAEPILFIVLAKKSPVFTDSVGEISEKAAEAQTWDWNE